jgi:pyruvate dehydrogenase E2 component (dihydrolipoamide acetyltransferase)
VLKIKRIDGVTEALRRLAGGVLEAGRQRVRVGELPPSVPTLVVWGALDRIVPAAHAAAVAPHAHVHVLPASGHSPHMEAAHEVNRLVESFVAGARFA